LRHVGVCSFDVFKGVLYFRYGFMRRKERIVVSVAKVRVGKE